MEDNDTNPVLAKDVFLKYITACAEVEANQDLFILEFILDLDNLSAGANWTCVVISRFIVERAIELMEKDEESIRRIKSDALADQNANYLDAKMRFVCHLRQVMERSIPGLMVMYIHAGAAIMAVLTDGNMRRANDMVRWTMEFLYDEKVEKFLDDDIWDMYGANPEIIADVLDEHEHPEEHMLHEQAENAEQVNGHPILALDVFLMYIAQSINERADRRVNTADLVDYLQHWAADANPRCQNIVNYVIDWRGLVVGSTRKSIKDITSDTQADLEADCSAARRRFIGHLQYILSRTVESLMLVFIHAGEAILLAINKGNMNRAKDLVKWTDEFLNEQQVELFLEDNSWEVYARGNAPLPYEIPQRLVKTQGKCDLQFLVKSAVRATWMISLIAYALKHLQEKATGQY